MYRGILKWEIWEEKHNHCPTCWEHISCPAGGTQSRAGSPVTLNPAFSSAHPQQLLGGLVQWGAEDWETHLPFAESSNLLLGAVLSSAHSDAGTDLFSHPRILHTNHLVVTEGWCDPWGHPSPPAGYLSWKNSASPDLYHGMLESWHGTV